MRHRRCLAPLFVFVFGLLLGAGAPLAAAERDARLPDLARAGDHAGVADLLADASVDVDAPGVDGTTALHWAAYADDLDLAGLLLDAGADPNTANRNGATPMALACRNANPALIARLLEAGADPSLAPAGEPPLLTCARTGRAAAVRVLLAHGARADAADDWRGQTALMWAAAENHTPILNVLLESGAPVDAPSTSGFTALMFAVRQDARAAAHLLMTAGADVNARAPIPGSRPRAADAEDDSEDGADSNADSKKKVAPAGPTLLSMAVTNGHFTMAAMLLDAGADASSSDARGNSLLHDLVQRRTPQRHLANQFVDAYGVDPTQLDSLELMRKLVAHGADPNARTEPTPIRHERWTDEGIFSAGRPYMDNGVNLGGATPYVLAAQGADVEAMRELAALGADPRLASYANNTPLMMAAGVGHIEGSRRFRPESDALAAVELALAAGGDVNASNANGQTALHGAVYRAADSIIRRLVEAGARTDFEDELDRSALDLAEQGFNQIASVIRRERSAELLRSLGAVATPDGRTVAADQR